MKNISENTIARAVEVVTAVLVGFGLDADAAAVQARVRPDNIRRILGGFDQNNDKWMTAEEAAEYLGLPTANALYQRVARGDVPVHRLGRRLLFSREELDELLEHGVFQSSYKKADSTRGQL